MAPHIGRASRTVAAAAMALFPVATPMPPAPLFDQAVYGDFALVGNTVTACPAESADRPVQQCLDGRQRRGKGLGAQNNGHVMKWADVDADPATYNSSSARLPVPPGARIVHATLTWAGGLPAPDRPCGGSTAVPPGTAATQALSLSVDDKPAVPVAPQGFRADSPGSVSSTDELFYSARADVTTHFVSGATTVTIGNVWTPRGHDCFGGWSLAVVWAFDGPRPEAPARRRVLVEDVHARVFTGDLTAVTRMAPVRAAGGTTRVGVTAFEGDWASGSDLFLVNGKPSGQANFFTSSADGALNPRHLNNMSVDATTVEAPDDTIRGGDKAVELGFTGGPDDAYLVRGVVVSSPLPELSAAADLISAHPGDQVTHTFQVTNRGDAPAANVVLHGASLCDKEIGRLAARQTVAVACAGTAGADDYQVPVSLTGVSLAGDDLRAEASAAVDVVHPAIEVSMSAAPTSVLAGQLVNYDIRLRSSGDVALSGVTLDGSPGECARPGLGTLGAGQELLVRCAAPAPAEDFFATVTASGTDLLGKKVSATAKAAVTVLHPRQAATEEPPAPRPVARVADLPVPAPVLVIGLATIAMSVTVSAIARVKR